MINILHMQAHKMSPVSRISTTTRPVSVQKEWKDHPGSARGSHEDHTRIIQHAMAKAVQTSNHA